SNKAATAASPQIRNSCRECGGRFSPSLISLSRNGQIDVVNSRIPVQAGSNASFGACAMTAWIETCRSVVSPWECDVTEHFTIAYYFDRLADASAMTAEALGLRD